MDIPKFHPRGRPTFSYPQAPGIDIIAFLGVMNYMAKLNHPPGGKNERVPAPEAKVVPVCCTPVLSQDQFDQFTSQADVVILIAYATGTTPDRLLPVIQKRIAAGVPVIMLSNNPGEDHGPTRLPYMAGSGALAAGAVLLQKVNVKHYSQVEVAVQQAFQEGKRGQELATHISSLFGYQPGEELPRAEWETAEGVANQRELTRQTLVRTGMPQAEIDTAMKRWEFGD